MLRSGFKNPDILSGFLSRLLSNQIIRDRWAIARRDSEAEVSQPEDTIQTSSEAARAKTVRYRHVESIVGGEIGSAFENADDRSTSVNPSSCHDLNIVD